jgi:hypothetical protein
VNINDALLAQTILNAARGAAGSDWKSVAPFAVVEMRKLARTVGDIEALLRRGVIDGERALQLFELQQRAAHGVLATMTSGGEPFAAQLLTAGLNAVRLRVLKTVGIDLLPSGDPVVPVAQFRAGKDL